MFSQKSATSRFLIDTTTLYITNNKVIPVLANFSQKWPNRAVPYQTVKQITNKPVLEHYGFFIEKNWYTIWCFKSWLCSSYISFISFYLQQAKISEFKESRLNSTKQTFWDKRYLFLTSKLHIHTNTFLNSFSSSKSV